VCLGNPNEPERLRIPSEPERREARTHRSAGCTEPEAVKGQATLQRVQAERPGRSDTEWTQPQRMPNEPEPGPNP
jgi:hypothetical protein